MSESLECGNCGLKLPLIYPESCPKCGSKKRTLSVVGEGGIIIGGKGIVNIYKKYRKINWFLLIIVILLSLIPNYRGYLIGDFEGIIFNIIISIIAFFLGCYAIIKIKEKEKYC
jgi:hypothetical protein